MGRLKCYGMRLRRIQRPKAVLDIAKLRLLIMVEKCEAVKRECARAEGVGLAEGEARAAKRPQGPAREPQPSELLQNCERGRKVSAAKEKLGNLQ